ncbi:MAG TPA: organic hydroperoxide resistance protein [Rickettsiales bacterium]|nr:organic hydroperoxide resistance protein [Rickettsiales bacterium]
MKTLYTARANVRGGREGHAETDDKQISVNLAAPGSGKQGTNPEQLFACGYAACFGSAVQHVARQQKIDAGDIDVQADVKLNQDDQGFSIAVELNVTLAKVDAKTAEKLVNDAHQVCPYSKATRGNIEVKLKANGQQLEKAA